MRWPKLSIPLKMPQTLKEIICAFPGWSGLSILISSEKKSFSICYLWLDNSFYVVIYYSYLIIHNSGLWKVNCTIEYMYLHWKKPFTLFCNSIKNSDIKVIFHSDKVRMHQFCPPTTNEKLVLNGMYVRNAYLLSFKILFHPLKCM